MQESRRGVEQVNPAEATLIMALLRCLLQYAQWNEKHVGD